ncbi:winged helix-turn-helix domain-containing protein [Ruania zhangjianzhongii]|uniref:winged helix-turn-helix domain-containing protein n=1 Tax=Ruania zhangjianzhongii TaxID=2603206 RepID=UPI0011CA02B7|nr:helix-turn-helix domain-containing protein [Ruania zhangjianzhongii]
MQDMQIVTDPKAAALLLDPVRRQLLAAAGEPASAAQLAQRVGLSRQKVNYHVRALEERGLLQQVEERRWGGITERLLVATAISYVVSPEALGEVRADPRKVTDRLSAQYLVALATRAVREVGELLRRAGAEGQQVATLSVDSVVRFRSAGERAQFADDLGAAVRSLVARYHAADAADGREHRLVIAVHPIPADSQSDTPVAVRGKEQS